MLNRGKIREASQMFMMLYVKTLQSGPAPEALALLQLLAMQIPLADFKGLYRWFEGLPLMRHWIGDRRAAELKANGFEVIHKPWEATLKVLRDDVMFDKLQGYGPTIKQMANELKLLPWRETMKVIQDGFVGTSYGDCFDGYPLFSASHATGSNTDTDAFSATALEAAIKAMRAQTDPTNGDNLLIEPTHLWYHHDLEARVSEVLDQQYVIDGTGTGTVSNRLYKKLQKAPMLGFTSGGSNYWGLLSISAANDLRPVLWQYVPGSDAFVALDKEDDEDNFKRRELLYGVEYWGAAAPGFPQYIWGSDGTT